MPAAPSLSARYISKCTFGWWIYKLQKNNVNKYPPPLHLFFSHRSFIIGMKLWNFCKFTKWDWVGNGEEQCVSWTKLIPMNHTKVLYVPAPMHPLVPLYQRGFCCSVFPTSGVLLCCLILLSGKWAIQYWKISSVLFQLWKRAGDKFWSLLQVASIST